MMTYKQREIYTFIKDVYSKRGVAPTLNETAQYFNVAGSTMHEHLQHLVRNGYLRKEGSVQAYMPVDDVWEEIKKLNRTLWKRAAKPQASEYERGYASGLDYARDMLTLLLDKYNKR
jgi:SOS-response transcriptional repressor LexA